MLCRMTWQFGHKKLVCNDEKQDVITDYDIFLKIYVLYKGLSDN